jgi:hypothetical protein
MPQPQPKQSFAAMLKKPTNPAKPAKSVKSAKKILPPTPPGFPLYIRDLPLGIPKEQLSKWFTDCGPFHSVHIFKVYDPGSERLMDRGVAIFKDEAERYKARGMFLQIYRAEGWPFDTQLMLWPDDPSSLLDLYYGSPPWETSLSKKNKRR